MIDKFCEDKLDLSNAQLSDEYYYKSLPLCVIDAVFSVGIRYQTTRNVVINFCNKQGIDRLRTHGSAYPLEHLQLSVDDFLKLYKVYGLGAMTDDYFKNKNRTSSKNGILKSEAVEKFCAVLKHHKVNYFQDLHSVIGNDKFEQDIKKIPGQKKGISLSYFYMLAGDDNFIKPDRMILRFVESCTNSKSDIALATKLLMDAHKVLVKSYPKLTPRGLDHEIWKYQRNK